MNTTATAFCAHVRSCGACDRLADTTGEPCGAHVVGTPGHERCTGKARAVITNTSAVASIDGDDLNTIHASDMADTLASYQRSTALVVDTSDLHALRRLLATDEDGLGITWDEGDAKVASRIVAAITATLDAGLR